MASPYDLFKTSAQAEKEIGIDLDYGAFKIRIARAGGANREFIKCLTRKRKPYRNLIDNDAMDSALADKIMAEVFAETIILGWDGVTDEKGKALPFTRENCIKLLIDLPDLLQDIQVQASTAANFREKELAADAKNSGNVSAGN